MSKPKWSFKSLKLSSKDIPSLVELSVNQKPWIDKYTEALLVASESTVSKPSFSQYFVKESIGVRCDNMTPAGNIEYGLCQALHGEESAVAAFRANYGRRSSDGNIILGILAGSSGEIANPCGNCRDIMLEDLGSDFEIVSGTAEGGLAIISKMSDYLFSDFKRLSLIPVEISKKIDIAIEKGSKLVNDAYSPSNILPERKYHALIATENNNFVGAMDIMCDYHPIYALRDAVRQARRANDPFIKSVVIVCCSFLNAPHVMYKDRQHLLELNLQQELLLGQDVDPPVYLVTVYGNGEAIIVWQTSVKRWLPLPFSPRNFGPEFIQHLTAYFKGLGRH